MKTLILYFEQPHTQKNPLIKLHFSPSVSSLCSSSSSYHKTWNDGENESWHFDYYSLLLLLLLLQSYVLKSHTLLFIKVILQAAAAEPLLDSD